MVVVEDEDEDILDKEEDKPAELLREGERGRRGDAMSRRAGRRGEGATDPDEEEEEEEGDGSGELSEMIVFSTRSKLCSTGDGG